MPTTTSPASFQQIVTAHGQVITKILGRRVSTDPTAFVQDVRAAADALDAKGRFADAVRELRSALLYLGDALETDGAARINLLRKVDLRFRFLNERRF
ncbi:hypothetical protein [Streptomyces noursei]|uniref:hypothetical protein n=1 Tax=Streptomyces noursei TaxID=1971 RepID=UPI00167C14F1|nr:hypothetical protein [Streptomyces noursei]MCZ1013977.1 hypothetical protein [Streptomyces noursei]GGX40454.1 hypothetical protein GCM10010341_72960 [Streptomyces noursei]